MNKIAELRPYQKKVTLLVKVAEKMEPREVTSRLDNSNHKVAEALVADDSGSILLTLWDDTIDSLEEGKNYELENAYTSLFKSSLRINLGRYGSLKESKEKIEANTENNISEKEMQA